jgi:SsrA-binding protein
MNQKSKKKKAHDPNERIVCRNRKARHRYDIIDQLECGIALQGSEVKSIRNGKVSIDEAYVRIRAGELWLTSCNIAEYPQATIMNHDPMRPRKLLLHKRQFRKFAESAAQQGLTIVPLSVHFSRGLVKIQIAVARGRKLFDKREKMRKEDAKNDMRRVRAAHNAR